MKCPRCQFDNREGVGFCEKCGVRMELICPDCGAAIPPDRLFCGACGQSLSASSSVVPPRHVPSTDGERKHVTVLFSDLSGYTALSEKLDPEAVKEITTRIFGDIAQIVARYDGFIEKYIGDAVVALFGVPKAHEDDHLRAIRAAQEIHDGIEGIATDCEQKIGRRLTFHSGIATGLVVTGEVNLEKGTHGVAGDTINLASRLSGLARPGEILVGEGTYRLSNGVFSFEKLEPVSVKGKAGPVTPYRLIEGRLDTTRGPATQRISSPLVGRSAEVAAIKASVNRLLDGQGGILSVVGEAGLGKSRLMTEIRHSFVHVNLLWLEGRTLSYGQKMSYWPFREMLWQYAGITEDDSDVDAWKKFEIKIVELFPNESGEILPYLASLIGLEVKGDLAKNLAHMDGESMGRQIYLSSRRFFERLAQNRSLVLVFEDLHWADESTVALVAHLFPLVTRVPLLICGISRPEENSSALRLREVALKDHERRYTEIRLSPLSPTECTSLMENLLPIVNLPSHIRQLILAKADGNPFFVEEIMRTLVDRGAVHSENGHWKASSEIGTITIPDTIQGVIMARIDRLDEEVKQVLKTASVIGRAFLYRLLKEVTEAVKDLDHDLDRLTEIELIREKQRVPEVEYIFKHALVQESTYESILLRKRHELHGKVASAVETLFADRLDEFTPVLSYHYAKAERWEKAQEYLFKAGDQAGRIAADVEALAHYQQALETYAKVFGDKWDPIQRGILERKMGEAFYRRGEYERTMEYFQRALEYLGRERLPATSGKVRMAILREIGVLVGRRIFSRSIIRKTHEPTIQIVDEVARTYALVTMMDAASESEHFLLTTLASLNFAERNGCLPAIVTGYASLGMVSPFLSLFRLGRQMVRRAVLLSKQTDDPSALINVYASLTGIESAAGRLDQSIEYGLKGREISRTSGYWSLAYWSFLNAMLLYAYYQRGDLESALAIAEETVRCGQDANEAFTVANGIWCMGFVQERIGNFQECIASLTRAIELSEALPSHTHRVMAGSILGRCYCRAGDIDASLAVLAKTDAYRVTHRVRGWGYYLPAALCMTYVTAAEHHVARKRDEDLTKAKGACKSLFRWAKGYRVCLPEAMRLRGVHDWLTGKQTSAQKHWQRSIGLAEEMGMRYDLGMTHLEMGRRLTDHDHLQQAEAIFADIGAEFDLAETRRLLQP
jgi:class 3 adenylate cyclase/tetratricopeptide (TPR) repeat protein